MAADDVASSVGSVAEGPPLNDIVEIGGPEQFGVDDVARIYLAANEDERQVITDPFTSYFGVELTDDALLPDAAAQVAAQTLSDWLNQSMAD
jgi:uncharacterized protein YbjT (DUF2867 family)